MKEFKYKNALFVAVTLFMFVVEINVCTRSTSQKRSKNVGKISFEWSGKIIC
jgi:hypothetical protein